jgi:UPF0755 protein
MRKIYWLLPVLLVLLAAAIGGGIMFTALQPLNPSAKPAYFQIRAGERVGEVLDRAEREGLIKSAAALKLYNRFFKLGGIPKKGTYRISASQPAMDVARELLSGKPIRQMVFIREGLWAAEIADALARAEVCDAKAFRVLAAAGAGVKRPFLVPGHSLEGYLFPDTYDLPPLIGAAEAADRMLDAFERKVYKPLGKPPAAKLREWVIVGSMVELEAKQPGERAKIAGVITNRLESKMPLQVDATILYALKERRRLFFKDYGLESRFNTYRFTGLPPGPICSPGADSIRAAAHPAKHPYLYYVAMPDGSHLFAQTFDEHRRNIITARSAFAARR